MVKGGRKCPHCCVNLCAACAAKNPAIMGGNHVESEQREQPTVVCLCGSTRFVDVFAVVAWELEKRGKIVHSIHLLPEWYASESHHQAEAEGVAEILDELHLRKIDLSDEVMVIDVDGYIGESTSNEIAYAKSLGKPITFLSESEFSAILGTESKEPR